MDKYKGSVGELRATQALKMLNNTISVVKGFDCNFIIENPANNLSRPLYIKNGMIPNESHYCMYDENRSKKPTNFYSDSVLYGLLKCNHKKHTFNIENAKKSSYAHRSSVPELLIVDILKQKVVNNGNK